MPLFEIKNHKAVQVHHKDFSNELELHRLIDKNLSEIFGIRYLRDEYITAKHGRIETLGIDDANRPVVIEYKLRKDRGQLAQANRYITWVKQNPDSFELLVRKNIKSFNGKIDFENCRIICFAQDYDMDDKCLALALGAELWKYRYYQNDMLFIVKEDEPGTIINPGPKPNTGNKPKPETRAAKTIEEHLDGATNELKDLFYELDSEIKNISSEIEYYTTNTEIIYKTSRNFACIAIQKSKNCIRIYLRTRNNILIDPKDITKSIPKHFGYGNISRQLYISHKEIIENKYSLNDIIDLISQAYETTQ